MVAKESETEPKGGKGNARLHSSFDQASYIIDGAQHREDDQLKDPHIGLQLARALSVSPCH